MTASVELETFMITLRLKGHGAGVEPELTVMADGKEMSRLLRDWEHGETETSVRVSNAGVKLFPARLITYAWEAGGSRLTGEHLYINPKFPFRWKREQYGPFIIYHTGTLTAELATQWANLYTNLAGSLGLQPVERTIYMMPDKASLQKTFPLDPGFEAAGRWTGPPMDALLLVEDYHPTILESLIAHEFAHAFLYGNQPSFWEEGIATWLEAQMTRRGSRDWVSEADYRQRFGELQQVMKTEGTFLMQGDHKKQPPLDPYTIGFSFALYLQDRFGQNALIQAAVMAQGRPLGEALEKHLGEGLGPLEEGWREFVRTGAHLKALSNP